MSSSKKQEIRDILGAPLPDHYYPLPSNESDAWKENRTNLLDLIERVREKDRVLLRRMRRARRAMLFSVPTEPLIVNAGTKAMKDTANVCANSIGQRVSSLFAPLDSSVEIDKVVTEKCWHDKKDLYLEVSRQDAVFGMCMMLLYNDKDETVGLVYVFKPVPNIARHKSEDKALSHVRTNYMRTLLSSDLLTGNQKLMLRQILNEGGIQADDSKIMDEGGIQVDDSKITKKVGEKRKRIEWLRKPIKFRQTAAYLTTPSNPRKVLLCTSSMQDITSQETKNICGKSEPVLKLPQNGKITKKELKVTKPDGSLDKIVHLVRQEIVRSPRMSDRDSSVLNNMTEHAAKFRNKD
mgnify:CR=1 FL=1